VPADDRVEGAGLDGVEDLRAPEGADFRRKTLGLKGQRSALLLEGGVDRPPCLALAAPSRYTAGGCGTPLMRTTPVPRFLTALVAVTRRFLDDQGFLLAAALSFSFLLCLAPLTLLLFSAAGFILESNAIAEYVLDSASYLLPGYAYEVLQVVALLTRERGPGNDGIARSAVRWTARNRTRREIGLICSLTTDARTFLPRSRIVFTRPAHRP